MLPAIGFRFLEYVPGGNAMLDLVHFRIEASLHKLENMYSDM